MQEGLGLKMATDGEFRRKSYWGHWVDAIDGFDVAPSLFTFHDETGEEQAFIAADCVGPLNKVAPISTEEFAFLKTAVKRCRAQNHHAVAVHAAFLAAVGHDRRLGLPHGRGLFR